MAHRARDPGVAALSCRRIRSAARIKESRSRIKEFRSQIKEPRSRIKEAVWLVGLVMPTSHTRPTNSLIRERNSLIWDDRRSGEPT